METHQEQSTVQPNHLVENHTRFKKLVSGNKYEVVEPVLPMYRAFTFYYLSFKRIFGLSYFYTTQLRYILGCFLGI